MGKPAIILEENEEKRAYHGARLGESHQRRRVVLTREGEWSNASGSLSKMRTNKNPLDLVTGVTSGLDEDCFGGA